MVQPMGPDSAIFSFSDHLIKSNYAGSQYHSGNRRLRPAPEHHSVAEFSSMPSITEAELALSEQLVLTFKLLRRRVRGKLWGMGRKA